MKQLMKSILGICCVLLISELALRVLAPISLNIRFFTTNPYQQTYFAEHTGWKGITAVACQEFTQYPGAEINGFILNSHGFLNPEYPYQKPDNTKRIVFLGDSQTFGEVPYAQGFVRRLESQFVSAHKKVQTINLGAICIGPATEKQILIHEGIKFEPNVVVLGFFVGNDFEDDKDTLERYENNKVKTHLFPFWVYQSRLYSLIRNMRLYLIYGKTSTLFLKNDSIKTGIDSEHYSFDPNIPTFTESDYLNLENKRTLLFDQTSDVYFTKDKVLTNLFEMKQLTEHSGAKFLVLIIPDELQINKALQEKINRTTPINGSTISLPQTILKTFFNEQNIEYIDLLSAWEASPAAQNYYLPRNTHLNKEGNQAVADILYPKLIELLQ